MDTHADRTDADLIRAAAAGDDSAFADLYQRHRDWTISLAVRFTRDPHLALDITQETFIFLAGRIPTLTLTAKLTTYLYPVVRSIAATHLRKRGREVATDFAEQPHEEHKNEGPAAPVEQVERDARVRRAVNELPVAQQETLQMRFVSGMSLGDIAIALGVPLGTVKSRLHNALRSLEGVLKRSVE